MDSGSALRFVRNDGFDPSPNQSRQPANPAAPNKNFWLSMDGENAPHPKCKNVVAWQTHVPPLMTGLLACPNNPSARWQPILPADPVPTQSGRNSGPLILGIVTLHRPD